MYEYILVSAYRYEREEPYYIDYDMELTSYDDLAEYIYSEIGDWNYAVLVNMRGEVLGCLFNVEGKTIFQEV